MVEDQLGYPAARRVAAKVDHVQADTGRLELAEDVERVEVGAEPAVELRRDDHVAPRWSRCAHWCGSCAPGAKRLVEMT
jgi:hypothetical protein